MKVTFSDNIGITPAIVRRDTGEIFLNRSIWFTLPEAYRQFILFHEAGHYVLQTTNELVADHFAFTQIAGTRPESLKNTVRTLYGVLPFNTELQGLRLINMYRLALTYDQMMHPTATRLEEIRRIETTIQREYSLNQQFQEYIMLQKGKITDYQFPGYDPGQFNPSVGKWFKDIPIKESNGSAPWPTKTSIFIPKTAAPTMAANVKNNVTPAVPLDLVPDYRLPFDLDVKSIAIGILVILAIIGLTKA